ncbi:MAG: manganese efflux pump [Clostridia bacterium]|nr:manganese efflux pump [Clostridia bacterium]
MTFAELLILAIGLSMDAFAVAICKGLCTQQYRLRHSVVVGAWFGGFQALMPAIGFLLGSAFEGYIKQWDHWVAFVLLGLIGANMIRESFSKEEEACERNPLAFRAMLIVAIATSIDALAVGVTFAFLSVNLPVALLCIGVSTFLLSGVGVRIGNVFGARYKSKAEFSGGLILILLGTKILLEHLGIINF